MTLVPSGLPGWSRVNTFANYGGSVNKANFRGEPALGGGTDLDASDFLRMVTDLSSAARTMPLCVITCNARSATGDEPLVSYCAMPTGVYSGEPYVGDNPPNGFPTVTSGGSDVVVITLPETMTDEYGAEGSVSILSWHGSINTTGNIVDRLKIRRSFPVTENAIQYSIVDFATGGTALFPDNPVTLVMW